MKCFAMVKGDITSTPVLVSRFRKSSTSLVAKVTELIIKVCSKMFNYFFGTSKALFEDKKL